MEDKNWLAQQLDLLLTGYGYNLYNSVNRARADDLLVRQKAAGLLGDAADRLARLGADYAARCLPAPTREQPFPPSEKMALLREIEKLRDEASVLASRIRGMSVPTQDRTWARFRNEEETLQELLRFDVQLIRSADAVAQSVEPLTPESWTAEHAADLRATLLAAESIARERARFLEALG